MGIDYLFEQRSGLEPTYSLMTPIRILLVDDSLAFLESAIRFLDTDDRVAVVGQALSGREGLERVEQLRPDLVLMDLAMPEMNGLKATSLIKMQANAPQVIILTLSDSSEYRAAATAAGADDFVTKSEFATALLPSIDSLFADSRLEKQEIAI